MIISVTEDDIRRGVVSDCEYCPIARAVKRCFETNYVFVSESGIEIFDDYYMTVLKHRFEVPFIAQKFIQQFDDELPVSPFEFEVNNG